LAGDGAAGVVEQVEIELRGTAERDGDLDVYKRQL